MEIGKYIKELREEKGLSMQELAEKSGFKTRQSIGQIESGAKSPTLTTLQRIAEGLGMKINPEIFTNK